MEGPGRVITDDQVAAMVTAVGLDLNDLSASTCGDFMEDPAAFAAGVVMLEATVMTAYGVDADTIAGYREPSGD